MILLSIVNIGSYSRVSIDSYNSYSQDFIGGCGIIGVSIYILGSIIINLSSIIIIAIG